MTKRIRILQKTLCLLLAIIACLTAFTACNDFEEEDEPKEAKTYEIGSLAFIPAADLEDNTAIAKWLKSCRENSVESIKIFCLTSYDEENLTSVYLFYLPHVNSKVTVNTKIVTYDYKNYNAFIDFESTDETNDEDVIYYLKTELIRPSVLQSNVTFNGKSGVMLTTQAQTIIDMDAIVSNTDVE